MLSMCWSAQESGCASELCQVRFVLYISASAVHSQADKLHAVHQLTADAEAQLVSSAGPPRWTHGQKNSLR